VIVREEKDGSLVLINQNDHAKLSGLMAAHWGNENFAAPKRWESFVRGAGYHDSGWTSYETAPIYDAAAKTTPHFPKVPLDDAQLDAYQGAIDWLWNIDAYAGLLISRHRTGLWQQRYGAIAYPPLRASGSSNPDVAAFIERNEARQEEALASLDRNEFAVNYHLLQIVDLLSLYFCVSEPADTRVDFAPTSYDGAPGVSLNLSPKGNGRIAIDPYPFAKRPFEVSVVCKRLPTRNYPSQEEFRRAYFSAVPDVLRYTFV
jgi:hypothetical protein